MKSRSFGWMWISSAVLAGVLGPAVSGCGSDSGPFQVAKRAVLVVEPPARTINMSTGQQNVILKNDGNLELIVQDVQLGTVIRECPTGEQADPTEPSPSDAFSFEVEKTLPFRIAAKDTEPVAEDEGSRLFIGVRLAKQYDDKCLRRVTLSITMQNEPDYKVEPYSIEFRTVATAPDMAVSPATELVFGAPGQCQSTRITENVRITNTGNADLLLDRFCIDGPIRDAAPWLFVVHMNQSQPVIDPVSDTLQLQPGDFVANNETACPHGVALDGQDGRPAAIRVDSQTSAYIPVTFDPDPTSPTLGAETRLYFYAADTQYEYDEATGGNPYPLYVRANKDIPCLETSVGLIEFLGSFPGMRSQRTLTLTNCGDADLVINGLDFTEDSSASFTFELAGGLPVPTADSPLTIKSGEDVDLDVVYTPEAASPLGPDGNPINEDGTLRIYNNSCVTVAQTLVEGYSVEQTCPMAVIEVLEGDEVIPQTVLHMRGDESFGPGGTGDIVRWEWTVDQPTGSQSVFVPSNTFPNPTFEANIAGTYVFHLTVYDRNGVASSACGATVDSTINVIPNEAIHIELLWNTPGDDDETDTGPYAGSDLDLHFMHPNAPSDPYAPDLDTDGAPDPYFDQPWDTFWFNPRPDWGAFGTALDDNPSLDRDDTDGAGPENINLDVPEDNKSYRVGVHYWDDHGFGPAYATVRIYIYAELVFEVPDVMLVNHDLWCVAYVEWPSGRITMCQQPGSPSGTYWLTHGYQHPDFYNPGS